VSLCVVFLCPCGAILAQDRTDFRPIDWINADQVVAVRIDNVTELMTRGIASQFWSQESTASVARSIESIRIKELLAKAGFEIQDLSAKLSSLIDEITPQEMYFFIDSRLPSSSAYMICLKTKVNSIDQVESAMCKFLSATVLGFDSKDVVRNTVQETEFLIHSPSGLSAFMYRDWLFIHPTKGIAEANVTSLKGNRKPRFSFAENRKWISADKSVDSRGDIEVYVDPSIARKLFPTLTPELWQQLGLTDILGSAFRISIDEQTSGRSSACSPVIRWEGVIRIATPRNGFWKILDGLRPIPQVPVLPMETQSALFVNCDPQHVWKHAEQWIDSAIGPNAVAAIRREAETLGFNFETEFLSSWNGFFGNLQFGLRPVDASPAINEPVQRDLFGDFCVIAGVANKKGFQSIAEKIVFRGKTRYHVETESDLVLLYLSADDRKERFHRIRERNREAENALGSAADRDQDPDSDYVGPNIGVALTDRILVYGTEVRGREFADGRYVELAESNSDVQDIYRSFDRATVVKTSFAPCLAYYFWGNEVRTLVASIIWQLEKDRQAKTNNGIMDLRGFQASVPDPANAETIEEWVRVAALRMMAGFAESIHVVAAEVGVDSNGIRLRGGVYTKPQKP
jgi:hypothetical protein